MELRTVHALERISSSLNLVVISLAIIVGLLAYIAGR